MLNCIRLRLLYQTERSDLYVYQHKKRNKAVLHAKPVDCDGCME